MDNIAVHYLLYSCNAEWKHNAHNCYLCKNAEQADSQRDRKPVWKGTDRIEGFDAMTKNGIGRHDRSDK